MKNYKKLIILIALSFISFKAFCHPHLFFTSEEEFVFEDNMLQGAWVEWTFDSYFSADIDFYYDWDDNNYYDAREQKEIYNNAFINLANFYYFIFIRQGNDRTNPDQVYNFSARQENGLLTYRFYIDLSHYQGNEIYFAVYDYTFFCNIVYPDNSITFDFINSDVKPAFSIKQNKDYPVYYDPWGAASDNTIYYEWKKGLEVNYPKEIHIQY